MRHIAKIHDPRFFLGSDLIQGGRHIARGCVVAVAETCCKEQYHKGFSFNSRPAERDEKVTLMSL